MDFRLPCIEPRLVFFKFCFECCLLTCDLRTILGGLGVGGLTTVGSGSGVVGTGGGTSIFSGVLTGDCMGECSGDCTGDLHGDWMGDFTGDFTGDLTGDLVGELSGDFNFFKLLDSLPLQEVK